MSRRQPTLRGRALMWLAQREHSRLELRRKLRHWLARIEPGVGETPGLAGHDVEPLLDALQAAGHLSDERFVESRVHARAPRFGNRRIEQELKQYGAEVGDAVRQQLKATEVARARQVWSARFGQPPANHVERARQMRFLAGRGFTADSIRRVLAGGESADDSDDDSA